MKTIIFILALTFCQAQEREINKGVQEKIDAARDYYSVSLFENAKRILVEQLRTDEGKEHEDEIRFHLGVASWYQSKHYLMSDSTRAVAYNRDALGQWRIVIKKFPLSERTKELNRYFRNIDDTGYENSLMGQEQVGFNSEIEHSLRFWNPTFPDYKLQRELVEDPREALKYYDKLLNQYDDPEKKFRILYLKYLLVAGYNTDEFGYKFDLAHKFPNVVNTTRQNVQSILKEMEELISGPEDIYFQRLVEVYYLTGIAASKDAFLSKKLKIKKEDKHNLEKVLELTEDDETNIYRLFAELWLGERK
jgi:hypothetical protein|tara:strand:- start:3 stop:920 length:918 start_codon:yes stop_codon:yes gene_type:complete